MMPLRCETDELLACWESQIFQCLLFLRRLGACVSVGILAASVGLSMPYAHAQQATQRTLLFTAWGSIFETIPADPMPWGGIDHIVFIGEVLVDDAGGIGGSVRVATTMQAERCCISPDPIKAFYSYKGTRTYACSIANPVSIPDDPLWRLRKERSMLGWTEKGLSGPIPVTGRLEGTDLDIALPSEISVTCEIFRGRGNASAGNPVIGMVMRTLPVPESMRRLRLSLANPKPASAARQPEGESESPITEYSIPDPPEFGARDTYGQFSGWACRAHVFDPVTIERGGAPPLFQYKQCVMHWLVLSLGKGAFEARAERRTVLPVPSVSGGARKSAAPQPYETSGPTFNVIHFKLLDDALRRAALKEGTLNVRATFPSESTNGLLFKADRETGGFPISAEGSRVLDLPAPDLELGKDLKFYYRWIGEPPTELKNESIELTVFVRGKAVNSISIGFQVGIDLEITDIARSLAADPQTDRAEPLIIKVQDRLRKDADVSKLTSELGVMPVLRVRRCGFQPLLTEEMVKYLPDPLLKVIQTVAPQLQLRKYSATPTTESALSSRVDAAELWAIPIASDGTLQIDAEGAAPIPSIRFQWLGDHALEVDIGGWVTGAKQRPLGSEKDIQLPDPKAIWPQKGCSQDPLAQDWYKPKPGGCPDNCWIWDWSNEKDKKQVEFTKNTLKISVKKVPPEDRLANAVVTCLYVFTGNPASMVMCLYKVLAAPFAIYDLLHNKSKRLEIGALATSEIMGSSTVGPNAGLRAEGTARDIGVADTIASVLQELKDVHVVLLSREGVTQLEATSTVAGRLQAGRSAQEIALSLAQGKTKPEDETEALPTARILSDPRYTIIPIGKDESLQLSLGGRGKPGEILVVTADNVTRVPFPSGNWQSSIQVSADGRVNNSSGTPLKSFRSSIAPLPPNSPLIPPRPEQPEPVVGAKPAPPIGAQCEYESHVGTCTIISMLKTAASITQSKAAGGPAYEGYEVPFAYTSKVPVASPEARRAMTERHIFRLANSWYPGPRFVEKYGISPGKSFTCTLRIRTSGPCAPILFDFRGIDTADMFEGR
jgi:hypothetical protein